MTAHREREEELLARVNASPFYRLLGFEAVEASEGSARVRIVAGEQLLQFQGAIHGGVVFSIADAAIAVALLTLTGGEEAVTVEGKVNYLAKVTGGPMEAVGRIVHRGRTVALGEADVFRKDGKLCGKALMTYMLVRREPL